MGCIAKKTGLPRLLLSLTIFVSAIVMIWLCFTTAATAPEQKVPSQVSMIGPFVFTRKLYRCIVNFRPDSHFKAQYHQFDFAEAQHLWRSRLLEPVE